VTLTEPNLFAKKQKYY